MLTQNHQCYQRFYVNVLITANSSQYFNNMLKVFFGHYSSIKYWLKQEIKQATRKMSISTQMRCEQACV